MKLMLFLIILTLTNSLLVKGYGETDKDGYPNHFERESINLLNYVRMFPIQYMYTFMKEYGNLNYMFTQYKQTFPVYYDTSVSHGARFHSYDMASKNYFAHNDRSGSFGDRVKRFVSNIRYYGENIAAGKQTGIETNNQLICDSRNQDRYCSADGSGNDGHRKNIMDPQFKVAGVGYYYTYSSSYKNYWTQDFAGETSGIPNTPIYSGYHTFYQSENPIFILSYYSNDLSTKEINIVFVEDSNENVEIMDRNYGNDNFGIYTHIPSFYTPCGKYYFTTTTNNNSTFRYPDTGYLQISKDITSCNSWTAN
ncbi:hypothetical protein DICPUDRAFT_84678 [Dictyostelium purpureum]|uniref:SCP domain-containing protein n=1 Tax=Dictyostelium purpureum TaxID=5786 RepID=F1A3E1_DICPU|nr:uncharacterized protein DICPUDRAFT_84678 [Dictyostelium purpureum]EGC29288.1 hypothetical protein DICPUDRAFT_84678 [Dictyostelium purpureum]|eukprot:XP_003294186.1 hypothetical protein DICPUDRAFT_84678 [Dictyostelium purpureum]